MRVFSGQVILLSLLLIGGERSIVIAQDVEKESGATLPFEQRLEALDHVEAQPALRFDFQWAEQYHRLLKAIEKNDAVTFSQEVDALEKNVKKGSPSQLAERHLILGALRQCLPSRRKGLDAFAELLGKPIDRKWDSDSLYAINDILEHLTAGNEPQNEALKLLVQKKLAAKFVSFEKAFDRSSITTAELSRHAFRYVRRLKSDEGAVAECERLLVKLKDDFGLISISIERLSALYGRSQSPWRNKYDVALRKALSLLVDDRELRQKLPLATPKVFIELSRLAEQSQTKLLGFSKVISACEEASDFVNDNQELSSDEKRVSQNTIMELRASALWDGYRVSKPAMLENGKPSTMADNFAPAKVASALRQVADIYRDSSPKKFFDAELSLASIYFDQFQAASNDPRDHANTHAAERNLLESLDTVRGRLNELSLPPGAPLHKYRDTQQDLELAWAEWTMQNRTNLNGPSSQPPSSTRELLLTRLQSLRDIAEGERKSRALTALGFLYLKYGDYQRAIDALHGVDQGQQFARTVILCLAYKDAGDFEASRRTLAAIQLDSNPRLQSLQKLIVLFVKSELPNDEGAFSSDVVHELAQELNEYRAAKIDQEKISTRNLVEVLEINNEHRRALGYVDGLTNRVLMESGENSANDLRQRALRIWQSQLECEGHDGNRIRARAAYSLAVTLLTTGSEALIAQKRKVASLASRYSSMLNKYEKAKVPDTDTYNNLKAQLQTITREEAVIRALEKEMLTDGNVRSYCLAALRELPDPSKFIGQQQFEYPNLAYNILCLILRVHLLKPDTDFVKNLSLLGWSPTQISEHACGIAPAQRAKIAGPKTLGTQRDVLFERYRDAFDLAVDLAVLDNQPEAALIGSQTTNQTIGELFQQPLAQTSPDPLKGKCFISFFVGNQSTHVFWRTSKEQKIKHHRAPLARATVASTVERYVNNYLSPSAPENRSDEAYVEAFELQGELFSDELKKDLLAATSTDQCVYVVPHGPLFQLPLDTLPTNNNPADANFLISACPPLLYLQSLATYGPVEYDDAYAAQLLTIQTGTDVGEESIELFNTFRPKLATRIGPEATLETSLSPKPNATGQCAKCELLEELERGYRFVHFGTHGVAAPSMNQHAKNSPLPARLHEETSEDATYLAGAQLKLWNSQRLSAAEVIDKFCSPNEQRLHTELVFLSACETQVSDKASIQFGGNTIKAMGTAFLVAGAKNVIASHWNVNDGSTERLVVDFMTAVETRATPTLSAIDYATILHQQRKKLTANNNFKAPYHWGPFTLNVMGAF